MSHEEIQLACLRAAINGRWEERCSRLKENYTYTKLVHLKQGVWMSDTPLELGSNSEFLLKANGHVLIFGLGIGLIVHPLIGDSIIESITAVELNSDVISLVAPYLPGVEVMQGDAYSMDFGKRKFDTIYFDIWRDRCLDNYEKSTELHKRYRKNMNLKNPNRYMNSWMRNEFKSEYYRRNNGR